MTDAAAYIPAGKVCATGTPGSQLNLCPLMISQPWTLQRSWAVSFCPMTQSSDVEQRLAAGMCNKAATLVSNNLE